VNATTAHYHVAIVGTDLAGLIVGALCAKRGYRVIVIGHGGHPLLYRHEEHVFCRRPQLIYGLGSPPVRHVFEQLGLGLELRNLPMPIDPGYQVVLPRARVDVTTHTEHMRREFEREFPGERQAIDAFYRRVAEIDAQVEEVLTLGVRMPPQGLIEGLKFRRLVKRFPFLDDEWAIEDPLAAFAHGHPFRALTLAPFRFASSMLPARPYPATLVRCINELRKGVFEFSTGPDTLRDLFTGIIRAAGDFRPDARATGIEIRRGRATHLQLRDRRQALGCDVLVCNTDPKRFFALIDTEEQREDYHHVVHQLQPIYYTFTGNFAVHADAIPEAMAPHVFVVGDERGPLEEENLVHIQRDPGPRSAHKNVRTLTASMRVPLAAASGGVPGAYELLDSLQRGVERVVPFLSEHLVDRHTPWIADDSATKIDLQALQPSYGEAIAHTLGTSPIATVTGYKNILMGSDASFCGFGSDGPYVAALHQMALIGDLVSVKSGF